MKTDAELFVEYRLGNKEALPELINRYEYELKGLLIKFTRDRIITDDLFQEIIIRLIRNKDRFDVSRNFKSWLFTITMNIARDYLRFIKRAARTSVGIETSYIDNANYFEKIFVSVTQTPTEIAEVKEKCKMVRSAIKKIPEIYRVPMCMYHFKGQRYDTIAKVLNVPIGTVKSRINGGLQRLRSNVTECCNV